MLTDCLEWPAGTVSMAIGTCPSTPVAQCPLRTTIGRVLATAAGDALDRVVGVLPADPDWRHEAAGNRAVPRRAIAVDGKALKGSARMAATHR
jgi:hypothetical protein